MKLLICLEYASATIRIIAAIKTFSSQLTTVEITVLHIIDEQQFYATTGYESEIGKNAVAESNLLKEMCMKILGADINYIVEYGIPGLKADEMIAEIEHDLLIVGRHNRNVISELFLGSFAAHLVKQSRKPVLLIP